MGLLGLCLGVAPAQHEHGQLHGGGGLGVRGGLSFSSDLLPWMELLTNDMQDSRHMFIWNNHSA